MLIFFICMSLWLCLGVLHGDSPDPNKQTLPQTSSLKNVVDLISQDSSLSTFSNALNSVNLFTVLMSNGPFTVFAPDNDAFEKLSSKELQDLFKLENREKLAQVLAYHIVPGKIMQGDFKSMRLKTITDKELEIKVQGGNVQVNGAKVIKTNLVGTNGVVHVIDSVLLP